jgi:phosphoribosylformimino-5-aminoimidazole carboxamide ribotide isomerase
VKDSCCFGEDRASEPGVNLTGISDDAPLTTDTMQIIPAIDLRGGRCVRLRQGDFDQETVFGDDPAEMAARWEAEGAMRIHLVDLDGARTGRPVNVEAVRQIARRVGVPCQLGGGVRDQATIAAWLEAGIDRLVVGTMALRDPAWFGRMAQAYSGRLLLGLDVRDGRVAVDGWFDVSTARALDLATEFDRLPLAGIIYTDIARDGTLAGPNLESITALAQSVQTPVIASGGVGELRDLELLAALPIAGCIVGRALYEGRFTLTEAIDRAQRPPHRLANGSSGA